MRTINISLMCLLVIYIAFSFCLWNINPKMWDTEVRVFAVAISVIIILICLAIFIEKENTKNTKQ